MAFSNKLTEVIDKEDLSEYLYSALTNVDKFGYSPQT